MRPPTGTVDGGIYRESPKFRRMPRQDTWETSGGIKGATDLPRNGDIPEVRRRYGKVETIDGPSRTPDLPRPLLRRLPRACLERTPVAAALKHGVFTSPSTRDA